MPVHVQRRTGLQDMKAPLKETQEVGSASCFHDSRFRNARFTHGTSPQVKNRLNPRGAQRAVSQPCSVD
jgi:hypothetical protein